MAYAECCASAACLTLHQYGYLARTRYEMPQPGNAKREPGLRQELHLRLVIGFQINLSGWVGINRSCMRGRCVGSATIV